MPPHSSALACKRGRMYLKLSKRISPKTVAKLLLSNLGDHDLEYDIENVYEWAYIDLPELDFSLNVTRDHGMSEIDDDELDNMSEDELESLPSAGATHVIGVNRRSNLIVTEIPEWVKELLCQRTQSDITVYPGRINIEAKDPEPIKQYKA
jgi:hypothetical protein